MQKKLVLLLLVTLLAQLPPVNAEAAIQTISIKVQGDGTTSLSYTIQGDPTSLQTNITLLGENIENLLIINEDGLPLEYTETKGYVEIISLGSTLLNMSYLTSDLTNKEGIAWTLVFDSPISTEIVLPSDATIINLNNFPLEIGSIDGRTQLIMQSGLIEITYTVNIIDSETLASNAIDEAETAINEAETSGVIVKNAKSLLSEAKTLFQQENYVTAEEKASQSTETVNQIIAAKVSADSKLEAVESAINAALEVGRTDGLDDAETIYESAIIAYESGEYDQASNLADQALDVALSSTEATKYTTIISAVVLVAIIGGVYLFMSRKPVSEPAPDHIEFDLEKLFDEHPELRTDDREVLRYLAENDGEAFAYDIRERFDIPRTSAWRMVQRLQRFEVVDERKIGGQSLISIKPEYRRQKE